MRLSAEIMRDKGQGMESQEINAATSTDAIEPVIEPDLPIIDAHHHLGPLPSGPYFIEDFARDLSSGHKVLATVYMECSVMYRNSGQQSLRCVGEAEYAAQMATQSDSGSFGPTRICAGFVGAADFTMGAAVDDVLHALMVGSGGRLRGIRGVANWDADATTNTGTRPFAPKGLLLDDRFRAGVARLVPRNLVYDAWQYHPQLPEISSLADAFPALPIVVNHCGGLLRIGPYAEAGTFARWKALVADAALRPNMRMKLGGLGAKRAGFGFDRRTKPPSAEQLANYWRPYVETCIELFGPARCMFESNFPPDAAAGTYRTIWNAFKLIAANCSATEKRDLFSGTARRVYGIH